MTTNIEAGLCFKGTRVLLLESGRVLSKVSYVGKHDEFWVRNDKLSQKSKKASQNGSADYKSYEENREFFDSSDFSTSLTTNPAECYWLAGWFQNRGCLEKHDPILADGGRCRRGYTFHVIFPDPEFSSLDEKVGEFFDRFRKGWIMINSVSAYKFFENFSADQIPEDYKSAYEKGLAGDRL